MTSLLDRLRQQSLPADPEGSPTPTGPAVEPPPSLLAKLTAKSTLAPTPPPPAPSPLKTIVNEAVDKVGGLVEGGLNAASGLGAGMLGLGAAGARGAFELAKDLPEIWKTGGRKVGTGDLPQKLEETMGAVQEMGTYKPKTEFGKTVANVVNSPFMAISEGANLLATKMFPNDTQSQAGVRMVGNLVIGAVVGKFGTKIMAGKPIFGKDIKAAAKSLTIPEWMKDELGRIRDDVEFRATPEEIQKFGPEWEQYQRTLKEKGKKQVAEGGRRPIDIEVTGPVEAPPQKFQYPPMKKAIEAEAKGLAAAQKVQVEGIGKGREGYDPTQTDAARYQETLARLRKESVPPPPDAVDIPTPKRRSVSTPNWKPESPEELTGLDRWKYEEKMGIPHSNKSGGGARRIRARLTKTEAERKEIGDHYSRRFAQGETTWDELNPEEAAFIEENFGPDQVEAFKKTTLSKGEVLRRKADDLLSKTGHTEEDIQEFKANRFMDGEQARRITSDVMAGKMTEAEAVSEMARDVGATVGKEKPAAEPVKPSPMATPTKQPWEMTREEYLEHYSTPDIVEGKAVLRDKPQGGHMAAVGRAISEGKPVPPEVLADYPDLAKPTPVPAPTIPQGEKPGPGTPPAPEMTVKGVLEKTRKGQRLTDEEKGFMKKNGVTVEEAPAYTKEMADIHEKSPAGQLEGTLDATLNALAEEGAFPDRIDDSLGIVAPPFRQKAKIHKPFADPEMERAYTENKGIRPPTALQKAGAFFTDLGHQFTRAYQDLPNRPENIVLKDTLTKLKKGRAVSLTKATYTMDGFVLKDPAMHDLFTRKILLDDLAHDADAGKTLPKGFTPANVKAELVKIDADLKGYPTVAKAVENRGRVMKSLREEYIKAMEDIGEDVSNIDTNDKYFRHQVIEYARFKGVTGTGKQLKTPKGRSFSKKREGSELAINTDYLEAEGEVVAQLIYDTEVAKAIKKINDTENIADRLRAEAKAKGVEWKTLIPEGHEVWQPDPGNLFYRVDTIPAKIAKQIVDGTLEDLGVLRDKLKKAYVRGGPKKEWVVRSEVAKTLNSMTRPVERGPVANFLSGTQRGMKHLLIGGPHRFPKFFSRNFTGDLEAVLVGNPHAVTKIPAAFKDVFNHFVKGKPMSKDLYEFTFNQGGLQGTLQAQEFGDIKNLKKFKSLYERRDATLGGNMKWLKKKTWDFYWDKVESLNNTREAVLRYAAYLDWVEQMKSNPEGRPKSFGASIPEEIMGLKNIKDRAARLSNEQLGAYDEVSVAGSKLREFIIPFWSWKELNFKRYGRLMKNAARDGNVAATVGKTLAIKAPVTALRVGKFAIKAAGVWSALEVYNNVMFKDEEADLPEDVRRRPHVVLGRNPDGTVRYFSRVGMLGDFLEWFGLDGAPGQVRDLVSGKKTVKDIALDMAKAPLKAVSGMVSPLYKAPFEIAARKTLFPDPLNPRPIRDRGQYLARNLGFEDEYKALAKIPGKGGTLLGKTWEAGKRSLWYESDPEETAYAEVRDMKGDWMKKTTGETPRDGSTTPSGQALYYFRLAVRYNSPKEAEYYLKQYVALRTKTLDMKGVEKDEADRRIVQGIRQTFKNMEPLAGLTMKQKVEFIKSLNGEDRETLAKAYKFYNDTLLSGLNPEEEDETDTEDPDGT